MQERKAKLGEGTGNKCACGRRWWGESLSHMGDLGNSSVRRCSLATLRIFPSFHDSIKISKGKRSVQREQQEQRPTEVQAWPL